MCRLHMDHSMTLTGSNTLQFKKNKQTKKTATANRKTKTSTQNKTEVFEDLIMWQNSWGSDRNQNIWTHLKEECCDREKDAGNVRFHGMIHIIHTYMFALSLSLITSTALLSCYCFPKNAFSCFLKLRCVWSLRATVGLSSPISPDP